MYKTVEASLKKLIKDKKGWPLVITGHSLGGGSSCLMYVHIKTMIFKGEFPDVKMLCYAFAPPPTFYPVEKLKPEHSNDIFVFVNDNDIVPRAGAYDLVNIILLMRKADSLNPDITLRQMFIHGKYKEYIKNTTSVRKVAHVVKEN